VLVEARDSDLLGGKSLESETGYVCIGAGKDAGSFVVPALAPVRAARRRSPTRRCCSVVSALLLKVVAVPRCAVYIGREYADWYIYCAHYLLA